MALPPDPEIVWLAFQRSQQYATDFEILETVRDALIEAAVREEHPALPNLRQWATSTVVTEPRDIGRIALPDMISYQSPRETERLLGLLRDLLDAVGDALGGVRRQIVAPRLKEGWREPAPPTAFIDSHPGRDHLPPGYARVTVNARVDWPELQPVLKADLEEFIKARNLKVIRPARRTGVSSGTSERILVKKGHPPSQEEVLLYWRRCFAAYDAKREPSRKRGALLAKLRPMYKNSNSSNINANINKDAERAAKEIEQAYRSPFGEDGGLYSNLYHDGQLDRIWLRALVRGDLVPGLRMWLRAVALHAPDRPPLHLRRYSTRARRNAGPALLMSLGDLTGASSPSLAQLLPSLSTERHRERGTADQGRVP